MARERAPTFTPDYAVRPGDTLFEIIEELGLSQSELAERTGRPKKTINEIVNGKAAITPDTALQFERVLGLHADFWNGLEQHYRAALARIAERDSLAKQTEWLKEIPVKELVRYGWIPDCDSPVDQLTSVLSFFGVASVDAWHDIWDDVRAAVAFRESPTFKSDFGALAAWLRRGELEAREISTAEFDPSRFRNLLPRIRPLSRLAPEQFAPKLIAMCASAGIAIAFVPALPKLPVCGATRWLSPSKAMVLLTNRYRTNDHLWFTFFHEAGHILLHGKRAVFVESPTLPKATHSKPDSVSHERASAEPEAHRFARDLLIPPNFYSEFTAIGNFSGDAIISFAEELDIGPGIVLGRLQHDGFVPYPTRLNSLLKESFALITRESRASQEGTG